MHYVEWGFSSPPFTQTALPADETGSSLLIGRDGETARVQRLLASPPKTVTVEGPNGVGKTSLVNVSAYRALVRATQDDRYPLVIPCEESFQLSADRDIEEFIDSVYYAIAQTLIKYAQRLKDDGYDVPDSGPINRWLNSPQLTSFSAGAGVLSLGGGRENNTGEGFSRSGFRLEIRNWLSSIFPSSADGGVVCVIDNLELLQESSKARQILETLRDPLISLPGTRWVLCGALGIVLGIAVSPRFDGLLHSPIEVGGLDDGSVPDVLESRVNAYQYSAARPYLPITTGDFEELYSILGKNLRSLLGRVDDYCQWCADNGHHPDDEAEKRSTFVTWLSEVSSSTLAAANAQVTPRAWQLFDATFSEGGRFSPGEFEAFGFNSSQAMRPHVKTLEDAGLVYSSRDDGDKRRKTVNVSAKGWVVRYARHQSSEAQDA